MKIDFHKNRMKWEQQASAWRHLQDDAEMEIKVSLSLSLSLPLSLPLSLHTYIHAYL